jgi:YggT family protein
MGGLDLSPIIVMIGIYALRIILINNAGLFL